MDLIVTSILTRDFNLWLIVSNFLKDMPFDKFDPAIWIPAQRLLEMSKWVGQGAEAASPSITSVRQVHTH